MWVESIFELSLKHFCYLPARDDALYLLFPNGRLWGYGHFGYYCCEDKNH